MKTQEKPTMRALELYQEQLQREAQRKIAADPYAQPYMPTLSEAGLKKLVQRAILEATPVDADEETQAAIKEDGPRLAIEILRKRAATADGDARRHAERAKDSLHRLKGLHAREQRKERDRRASYTPGQRIDKALAALSSVSMVPATTLESDQVKGGEKNTSPRWCGDQFGAARAKAVALAVELEQVVDEARVRDLDRAA